MPPTQPVPKPPEAAPAAPPSSAAAPSAPPPAASPAPAASSADAPPAGSPTPAPANPTAPAAEVRTVDEWEQAQLAAVQELYGVHAPIWLFRAARHQHGWAQGEPLTEEQFMTGLQATAGHSPEQR